MHSATHPHMRYVPSRSLDGTVPGIFDRHFSRFYPREYTAVEILETCRWLNARHSGHAPTHGALKLA